MRISELNNGRRIRLTKDVENPARDKRASYDAARLAWSEGDVWRVEIWRNGSMCLRPIHVKLSTRRIDSSWVESNHLGFAALVEASEELPESAYDVGFASGATYGPAERVADAVQLMIDKGVMKLETLRAYCELCEAQEAVDDAEKTAAKAPALHTRETCDRADCTVCNEAMRKEVGGDV